MHAQLLRFWLISHGILLGGNFSLASLHPLAVTTFPREQFFAYGL